MAYRLVFLMVSFEMQTFKILMVQFIDIIVYFFYNPLTVCCPVMILACFEDPFGYWDVGSITFVMFFIGPS